MTDTTHYPDDKKDRSDDHQQAVEACASTVTFYFDPATVAAMSDLDTHVRDTESFEAAHNSLNEAGYDTEFDLEQRLLAES